MSNETNSRFKSIAEARDFYAQPKNSRSKPTDIWNEIRNLPIEELDPEEASWFIDLGFKLFLSLSVYSEDILRAIGFNLEEIKEKTEIVQKNLNL